MARITKDTMISEIMRIDPGLAPILMSIGMHCLGCPASQAETLEQAAMVHSVDVNELVDRLNAALEA